MDPSAPGGPNNGHALTKGKALSNAMRSGKRWLAGVAAGALGAGLITFAAAPSATAADLTGTVSPVRVSLTASTLDIVPNASITWTTTQALDSSDTATVAITEAPTATARLAFNIASKIGAKSGTTVALDDSTASGTLANGLTNPVAIPAGFFDVTALTGSGGTGAIAVAASAPGTYEGQIKTYDNTAGLRDTISFRFTTVGTPTSLSIAPASQSSVQSGKSNFTVTLKDAAGNVTQPQVVDTITTAVVGGNTNGQVTGVTSTIASPGWGDATNRAISFWDGTAAFTYTAPAASGTFTVTATPAGTLQQSGVTTQSATVNVSGTVDDTAVTSILVTTPDNAITTTSPQQIPAGTSSVTLTVQGPASMYGKSVRIAAWGNATGSIDGVPAGSSLATATSVKDVALSSTTGRGTVTYALAGNLLNLDSQLIVQQTTAALVGIGSTVGIKQSAPAVPNDGSTVYFSPAGSIVAQLGTTTTVTVTVTNQFETPQSGYTIRALRGATLLSQAVTGPNGQAQVTVSPATGIAANTSETYTFTATGSDGIPITASGSGAGLTVLYTATGDVTSLSVAVNSGGGTQTTPILNTTTSIPTLPFVQVPFGGTVNAAGNAASTSVFSVATAGAGQAPTGQRVQFTPTANPANTVTVTVPEGVKVVDAAGLTASLLWSGGAQTVSVPSGQPVFVFATKTGVHDVTFTSGKISTVAKIAVGTIPAAAYNIAVSPATRTIEAGAFSTVEMTVSDVFGNPVPGVVAGTAAQNNAGSVTATTTGEVLLSGLNSSANYGTGADGKTTITLIAGKAGTGKVAFAPTGGAANPAAAWQVPYTPPTGAPAPVKSAEVAIVVTQDVTKSLVITGERATVSGKNGIKVDGTADGFEDGAKVKPWIRFPGETEYTAGSARPVVSDEEFTWQRKTGKKVYVYFTSEDDSIRSNRIIISAA